MYKNYDQIFQNFNFKRVINDFEHLEQNKKLSYFSKKIEYHYIFVVIFFLTVSLSFYLSNFLTDYNTTHDLFYPQVVNLLVYPLSSIAILFLFSPLSNCEAYVSVFLYNHFKIILKHDDYSLMHNPNYVVHRKEFKKIKNDNSYLIKLLYDPFIKNILNNKYKEILEKIFILDKRSCEVITRRHSEIISAIDNNNENLMLIEFILFADFIQEIEKKIPTLSLDNHEKDYYEYLKNSLERANFKDSLEKTLLNKEDKPIKKRKI